MAESEHQETRGSGCFLGGLIRLASTIVLIGFLLVLLAYLQPWSPLHSRQEPHRIVRQLEVLGDSALRTRDVPVAALVLYGDSVIGTGYNTVKAEGNAGGHAEINAISSALRNVGEKRFTAIARDSLVLVTTFEPCAMCRGAIVLYNIRRVEILKAKHASDLLREDLKIFRYYWQRDFSGPESLQDTLFRRHPDYRDM